MNSFSIDYFNSDYPTEATGNLGDKPIYLKVRDQYLYIGIGGESDLFSEWLLIEDFGTPIYKAIPMTKEEAVSFISKAVDLYQQGPKL